MGTARYVIGWLRRQSNANGQVYRGKFRGTEVAIKKLLAKYIGDDEQRRAFTYEADLMAYVSTGHV